MNRNRLTLAFLLAVTASTAAYGQHGTESAAPARTQTPATTQQTTTRDANREKLRALFETAGPKINVSFRQSDKQPYNFVGVMKTGLKNADSLEIVISVSAEETIHFRIFPHYSGAYLNIDKVKSTEGLMRQMVRFSDQNFLFWGADGSGDIFAGYNFTLESGFPEASIRVVLNSIAKLDAFVGQMRPSIDGSTAQ
ncbi:MAG TPA: hypothetical protein VK582_10355 [Pyrinomonadaceae bacterium]|nr:hypothetical protein [Pyrinomonadaceae bacterium]